jgi:hypothetical protein
MYRKKGTGRILLGVAAAVLAVIAVKVIKK